MSMDGGGFDLDRLLEQELQRAAGRLQGPSAGASQAAYHSALAAGGAGLSLSSVSAVLTGKAAIALAAAAVVTGGAAVTATATTGSPDPGVWGSVVVRAVQGCKATVGTGPTAANHTASGARDNIGQCVSAIARTHGATQRALHSHASDARLNHPTGAPTHLPHGKPSDSPGGAPHGPPSNVPQGGPPSDRPTPPHGRP